MTGERDDRPADAVIAELGVVRDLRAPAAQALLLLGELRLLTEWDDQTLCAQLGCSASRWVEVGGTPKNQAGAVLNSLHFLELASDMAKLADLTVHRREVVNEAFELCHDAGGPVADRVPRVRAALKRQACGGLSPLDLLSLGEIASAWRSAALNMDQGPAHDRATAAMRLAEPAAKRAPHISPERLAQLGLPDADDVLGPTVARNMHQHLGTPPCAKCGRAAERLGLGDMLSRGRLVRPGDRFATVAA